MTLYRIEGKPHETLHLTNVLGEWTPLEEHADMPRAEKRLHYWQHQFPFKDLFHWRISEVDFTTEEPKK